MWIADRLRAREAKRALTYEQVYGHDLDWDRGNTAAGVRVDTESAMRSSAMFACARLLAFDISTQPFDVVDDSGSTRRRLPPPRWLTRPTSNANDTRDRHFSDVVVSLLTDGNAFTHVLPSVLEPEFVYVLDPRKVTIRGTPEGDRYVYDRAVLGDGQVLHIPYLRLPGRQRGMNPIDAAREGIGIGLASQEFGNRYFSNGTTMSGIVEVPAGVTVDPENLRDQFAKRQQGLRKSHLVGVLTGGAKFRELSATPKDSMLVELWQWVVEDTARYYGIPPFKVGSQQPGAVAYASTSNARIEYVQSAVLPLVRKVEAAYSRLLPEGQSLRIDLNGLLRGDQAQRYAAYHTFLNDQIGTRDEVRAWEDLPPADQAPGIGSEHGGFLETPNNNAPAQPAA